MTLSWLRRFAPALAIAVVGWAGCASAPRPMIDPGYAARSFTPTRITVLPPDVFVVVDQVGDNDPVQSDLMGRQVTLQTGQVIEQALRSRGYDVDFSVGWDGVNGPDGAPVLTRDNLGQLANGIVAFANSGEGGGQGVMSMPRYVEPDLAARVGWATQSEALLYVNVKGAITTSGKRAASVVAAVFIVVIVLAIVAAVVASSKGGGGNSSGGSGSGGGWRGGGGGAPATRAAPSSGSWRGAPSGGGGRRVAPMGRVPPLGARPAPVGGAPVYRGGGGIGIGIGVIVPLDEPVYTHDGSVGYDDPWFAGDELYVSMTLVSTYDGRVLWHARDNLDLDADDPRDIERMVHAYLDTLPPRAAPSNAAAR